MVNILFFKELFHKKVSHIISTVYLYKFIGRPNTVFNIFKPIMSFRIKNIKGTSHFKNYIFQTIGLKLLLFQNYHQKVASNIKRICHKNV